MGVLMGTGPMEWDSGSPMRVLFDAYWWVSGPISNRTVLRETITEWRRRYPDDELHLCVRARHYEQARRELPDDVFLHKVFLYPHAFACMFEVPLRAKLLGIRQIVNQNFATALGPKADIYLHDLIFETSPEWFGAAERLYFSLMSNMVRRARSILTSSSTEARRIGRLHPKAARPVPTGLAPGTSLVEAAPLKPQGAPEAFRFVLAVGRLNIRKNLNYLVRVALSSGLVGPDRPLIVVGPPHAPEAELSELYGLGVDQDIRFTGRIEEAELAWYYRSCAAFIFLSRDEGFGLPIVEAQHFGAPLFLSDIDVMREVSQGRATFVPLDDPDGASEVIRNSLASLRCERGQAADVGPHYFTWKRSVSIMRATVAGGRM